MAPPKDINNDASPNPGGTTGDTKPPNNNKQRFYRRGSRKPTTAPGRPVARPPEFEGKCKELKGHIYDCSDARQLDTFVKTTKELAQYVGRTFKKGMDARLAIERLSLLTLTIVPAGDKNRPLNRL
jgi:hypothetical protein